MVFCGFPCTISLSVISPLFLQLKWVIRCTTRDRRMLLLFSVIIVAELYSDHFVVVGMRVVVEDRALIISYSLSQSMCLFHNE